MTAELNTKHVKGIEFNGTELKVDNGKAVFGFSLGNKLTNSILLKLKDGSSKEKELVIKKRKYKEQHVWLKRKYVKTHTDNEMVKRLREEYKEYQNAKKEIHTYTNSFSGHFTPPILGKVGNGVFGVKRFKNGKQSGIHSGVDIGAPGGVPIYSTGAGYVVITAYHFYRGKFVLIDHGQGVSSLYLHLKSIAVEEGDFVNTGDKIGECGTTGSSTGTHLHWTMYWNRSIIDPQLFLSSFEMRNFSTIIYSKEQPKIRPIP